MVSQQKLIACATQLLGSLSTAEHLTVAMQDLVAAMMLVMLSVMHNMQRTCNRWYNSHNVASQDWALVQGMYT